MKRLVMTMLAMAGCAAWAPVQAKEYVVLGGGDSEQIGYIDRGSVSRVDALTKSVWVVIVYRDDAVRDDAKLAEALFYLDCSGRRTALKEIRMHLRSQTKPVDMDKPDNQLEYTVAQPGTPGHMALMLGCDAATPKADSIVNADSLAELTTIADAAMAAGSGEN